MKIGTGIPAAIALWAGIGATVAQAAETAAVPVCVTHQEASGVILALAPEAIKAVGTACAQVLPPTALVRQTSGPYIARFQVEADRAWPQAKAGIGKLAAAGDKSGSGKETSALVTAMLDSDQLRPLLVAMIAPALTKAIKPKDCPMIDHMLTALEPLPPANLAEVIVSVLELDSADKLAKGKPNDVPICPAKL